MITVTLALPAGITWPGPCDKCRISIIENGLPETVFRDDYRRAYRTDGINSNIDLISMKKTKKKK